jgi:hypothetical protein
MELFRQKPVVDEVNEEIEDKIKIAVSTDRMLLIQT